MTFPTPTLTPPLSFLLLLLLLLLLRPAPASASASFPDELALYDPRFPTINNASTGHPASPPVSAVHFLDTWLFVGLASGVLFQVDVRSNVTQLLDPGLGRRFGGLCLDSRPPKTLYATGRDSGHVYAFDISGRLQATYQLAVPGTAFLAQCVQSEHHLIITDTQSSRVYTLPLLDAGPGRGLPSTAEPRPGTVGLVGSEVTLTGDWTFQSGNLINMYGIEWTQNFQRTVFFLLNSATGILYSIPISKDHGVDGTATTAVNVTGQFTTFKGGMGLLFEPSDESVLYITMPHWNAIAVLELYNDADARVKRAKFVKLINNLSLTNLPIALGEYGDNLYVASLRRSPGNAVHTLVRTTRYWPRKEGGGPFSTTFDNATFVPDESYGTPADIGAEVLNGGVKGGYDHDDVGTVDVDAVPRKSHGPKPSPTPYAYTSTSTGGDGDGDGDGSSPSPSASLSASTSASASASATPMAVPMPGSDSDGGNGQAQGDGTGTGSEGEEEDQQQKPSSVFDTDGTGGGGDDGDGTGGPTGFSSSAGACFPGDATVTVRDGDGTGRRAMRELELGDEVLLAGGRYGTVYMFSHRTDDVLASFVTLSVAGNVSVSATPGHYLPVVGAGAVEVEVRAAADIGVGDVLLLGNGRRGRVVRTSVSVKRGLYNPHVVAAAAPCKRGAAEGEEKEEMMVVDGVVATSFTTAVDRVAARALLAPVRATWRAGVGAVGRAVTQVMSRGGVSEWAWVQWIR